MSSIDFKQSQKRLSETSAFSSNSMLSELKYSFFSSLEAFCILLKYNNIALVSLQLKDLCVFGLKFSLACVS